MTSTYEQALDDLRRVEPFDGDADPAFIARVTAGLGLTDAHVVAYVHGSDTFFRAVPDPRSWTDREWDEHRRYLLAALQTWIAAPAVGASYSWMIHEEDDHDEFPGLRAPEALWWHLSLGFGGMEGDKIDPGAYGWYATAPEIGWLAYAAGVALGEYRDSDEKPDVTVLRTMLALRAPAAEQSPATTGMIAVARRVSAALIAFERYPQRADSPV